MQWCFLEIALGLVLWGTTTVTARNALPLGSQFPSASLASAQQLNSKNQDPSEELKLVWMGDGRAKDGTMLGMRSYQTPSGLKVAITHGKFGSPDAAQNEFRIWLALAAKIVEQGHRKDESGAVVGERAVALFKDTDASTQLTAVLWTNGVDYYWVSSSSPRLVFRIEDWINASILADKTKKLTK